MNIRNLREARGLTADQLSRLVGVDRVTIWNWEHGKTEPKFSQCVKLAEVFGVKLNDLCKEEN